MSNSAQGPSDDPIRGNVPIPEIGGFQKLQSQSTFGQASQHNLGIDDVVLDDPDTIPENEMTTPPTKAPRQVSSDNYESFQDQSPVLKAVSSPEQNDEAQPQSMDKPTDDPSPSPSPA